jgi:hypothetical protein
MEKKLGFKRSPSDPYLFVRGSGDTLVMVCLYVDDGYALGKKAEILKFFDELRSESINITQRMTT